MTRTITWRQRFRRMNFQYIPPLEQLADVVFSTDIPFDDEHLEEFDNVSWQAMWEQNPHWKEDGGVGLYGWSSVAADGEIVEAIHSGARRAK